MCPWVYICKPPWVYTCTPWCIYVPLGVYTHPWVCRSVGCRVEAPAPGCRVDWDSNQPGRRDSQRHQSGTLAWDIFQFSRLPKSKVRVCHGTSSKFSPLGHHNLAVWHGTSSNCGPLKYQYVLCCVVLCCVVLCCVVLC